MLAVAMEVDCPLLLPGGEPEEGPSPRGGDCAATPLAAEEWGMVTPLVVVGRSDWLLLAVLVAAAARGDLPRSDEDGDADEWVFVEDGSLSV